MAAAMTRGPARHRRSRHRPPRVPPPGGAGRGGPLPARASGRPAIARTMLVSRARIPIPSPGRPGPRRRPAAPAGAGTISPAEEAAPRSRRSPPPGDPGPRPRRASRHRTPSMRMLRGAARDPGRGWSSPSAARHAPKPVLAAAPSPSRMQRSTTVGSRSAPSGGRSSDRRPDTSPIVRASQAVDLGALTDRDRQDRRRGGIRVRIDTPPLVRRDDRRACGRAATLAASAGPAAAGGRRAFASPFGRPRTGSWGSRRDACRWEARPCRSRHAIGRRCRAGRRSSSERHAIGPRGQAGRAAWMELRRRRPRR